MLIYKPLSRDGSEIRVVRLLQSSDSETRISLELRHNRIEDGNYSALSYVWGDPTDPVDIIVNQVSVQIRKNLHQALTKLPQKDFSGWIWIDSLCIQQNDNDEKSYPVGLMRVIYGQADCVYSCIGEAAKGTDLAMDFFEYIGPQAAMFNIELDGKEKDVCHFIQDMFLKHTAQRKGTAGDVHEFVNYYSIRRIALLGGQLAQL
ncbi:heterokaryon incompatibility protein [Fusarium austroafricanum]|uniref:Heterokaryon incompatibility protein n=1 Tax=Fusarium austroafricanum TaxID=2364996 RepID=A0A8H4KPW2_9HYPO|nr:heterokaryon incompatibility protein [Fusarium austroafricanum]